MEWLTLKTLIDDNKESIQLELVNSGGDLNKVIRERDCHRPGLALSGFVDVFTYKRIQILGNSEITYLTRLSSSERENSIKKVLEFDIPCFIVTDNNKIPEELLKHADIKNIPVLRTPLSTTNIIQLLGYYLDSKFAPRLTMHASLVDVYGVGLLFTGRSGIGKSEIALDLVERGHQLVADDVVNITRQSPNILIGSGSEMLKHHMEIRGLGIIDIRSIFGIRSIKLEKRIHLEVRLEEWSEEDDYERIGIDEDKTSILEVPIPLIRLPIFPGKNITVIAEAIALNQILKSYGQNSAFEFNEGLMEKMQSAKRLRERFPYQFNEDIAPHDNM
ncbi:HPr kinase/phosphorylase [candidate division KSB1 bacterium]|nr:HPr kinase/phosphorylase [candidate division KSB1 bacterium]